MSVTTIPKTLLKIKVVILSQNLLITYLISDWDTNIILEIYTLKSYLKHI